MIRFGTDGWRAVIADEFTFENVRRVGRALGMYLADSGELRPVAVGHDTRFLSAEFAREIAETLAEMGLQVLLGDRAVPSPCISYNVHHMGLSCGVMITASHNPPRYNGVKLKASFGGTAPAGFTGGVADCLRRAETRHYIAPGKGRVSPTDFVRPYLKDVGKLVDMKRIRDLPVILVFDPMHGAARGLLHPLLEGGRLQIREIRGDDNPGFGGCCPEPIMRNLGPLIEAVRGKGGAIGLATDGDGDRLGAVDEEGLWVSPHETYAVLLRHLVPHAGYSRGRRVIKTVSTTGMIDKLALTRGIGVVETEVGFKHIVPHMLSGNVLMAGEESGGFCFEGYIPERDGILSGLKLLEAVAVSGRNLRQLVRDAFDEVGPHRYGRLDHPVDGDPQPVLQRLLQDSPTSLAGMEVFGVQRKDGLKMRLSDGSWLLIRTSGTEPLVRFYAEASSETGVRNLLDAARHLWANAANGTPVS